MAPRRRFVPRRTSALVLSVVAILLVVFAIAPRLSASGPQAPPSRAAVQQPTFRAAVEYVEVDAYVTDKAGRFVRDLRKEDFVLLEDGRRQEVANVDLIDVPRAPDAKGEPKDWMSAPRPAEPAVITNASGANGALYIIVLDDLHIRPNHTQLARAIAVGFVRESLGPNDIAAVVFTSGQARGQEFTQNRTALLDSINRMVGTKLPPPSIAAAEVVPSATGEAMKVPDSEKTLRVARARTYLETMKTLAAAAGSIHGRRKAAVLVSEGFDYDVSDVNDPTGRDLRDLTRDVVTEANRANLTIYPIDPQGTFNRLDEAIDIKSGMSPDQGWMSLMESELKVAQNGLRTAAAGTGGIACTGPEYARAFNVIRDDNSTYYLLAYAPPTGIADGKFHEIEVRVNRPDVVVRARKGYARNANAATPAVGAELAPPRPVATAGASQELETALRDPRPASGVLLSAGAAAFTQPDGSTAVVAVTRFDPLMLALANAGEKATLPLELVVVPVDAKGVAQRGERLLIEVPVAGENGNRFARDGFAVPVRLSLSPGRYQLRIGARDGSTGRIGTLRYDLDVPGTPPATLSFDEALLATAEGGRIPVVAADRGLAQLLEGAVAPRSFDSRVGALAQDRSFDSRSVRPEPVALRRAQGDPEPGRGVEGRTASPAWSTKATTVDELIDRANEYIADYAEKMSLVIGVEHYAQYLGDPSFSRAYKKMLVSEFALVHAKDDWVGFRDVYEIDGKPVADRQDRLRKLFLETPEGAMSRARRITDESARHNLGSIQRNFNVPTTALFFLQTSNVARFKFRKDGEDTIDGAQVWKVRYEETRKPTIIRTSAGRDMPVSGTFWIDPRDGRVVKTHMEISVETAITYRPQSGAAGVRTADPDRGQSVQRVHSSASITVTYKYDRAMGLLLPSEMLETYEGPTVNQFTGNEEVSRINCRATYSDFKKFETGARIK